MISGLAVGLGFGALAILRPDFAWAGFVAIFAGLLPFVSGLRGLVAERAAAPPRRKLGPAERKAEAERSVLRVAQERGGRVTPALIAIGSELSLEEAERVLQSMVAKGHALMQVREDGRIEYEFREFMSLPKP
ncbi:MAG TPA: hypothetical protein VMV90_05545 [Rectinemataceae bacterium]|nr:hypothetical protein [Rectinemataceae bacterium]